MSLIPCQTTNRAAILNRRLQTMPEPSKNYTYKLDDLTNTRLEWLVQFSKEIGVPKSKATKRTILTRAVEVYLECMEADALLFQSNSKNKEAIQERTALLKASVAQESHWETSQIPPDVELKKHGVFQTYKELVTPKVKPRLYMPKYLRKVNL